MLGIWRRASGCARKPRYQETPERAGCWEDEGAGSPGPVSVGASGENATSAGVG